jgi:hypothetical protein
MDGRRFGNSKRLGWEASWGRFENLLGRSYATFKSDTNRLYIQWKPADEGELLRPAQFEDQFRDLERRLAIVGLETWERVWVTRMDVSVDLLCAPEDGKALLDALAAVRLPRGLRVTVDGQPRSTVYFRPRASDDVLARAYCRNLKTRTGPPFGKIRLEAVQRFKPKEWWVEVCFEGDGAAAVIWEARYGKEQVDGRVTRLRREEQVLGLAQRVRSGEMTTMQFERMAGFLDAERLGIAREIYSDRLYSERRREARELGLSVNDLGEDPIDLDLGELLASARRVWEGVHRPVIGSSALPPDGPALGSADPAHEPLRIPGL